MTACRTMSHVSLFSSRHITGENLQTSDMTRHPSWLVGVPDPSDCSWCGRNSCPGCASLPEWMAPVSMTDLAFGLFGLGYAPVPLGSNKRPLRKWGPWRFERPTPTEVGGLFRNVDARGVAAITGRPHDLVVVDADSEVAFAWCLAHLPALRGVKSRRGGHLHFRHPEHGVVTNHCGEGAIKPAPGIAVDIKGVGGYVVMPYSLHPSGFVYEPLGDWTRPVSELPELPESLARLASWMPKSPATSAPRPLAAPTSDPERAFAAYLRKRGGLPAVGSGSHIAVFKAAAWCKAQVPGLTESAFVAAVLSEQPSFDREWIADRFRQATGAR
jgi:hypothetical protein